MQNNALDQLPQEYLTKIHSIIPLFKAKKVVVAFSGGIDSTLVVYLAKNYAANVIAVLINSPMTPSIELQNARNFTNKFEIPLEILEINTLNTPEIVANTPDRCYFCKAGILKRLEAFAKDQKFDVVMDGTNYSDRGLIRAGLKALKESHVISPLAEATLTKSEIIIISRLLDLPSRDIPSQACLASRIPFKIPLTAELLSMIDQAENQIREVLTDYKSNIRVRIHPINALEDKNQIYLARIEAEDEVVIKLQEKEIRTQILKKLTNIGFIFVTIDLNGFESGSMHKTL
jgi:uncharacterized protein